MLLKEQLRSLLRALRQKFRNWSLAQSRSLRALMKIWEIAIAPILNIANDQIDLGIEQFGVVHTSNIFNCIHKPLSNISFINKAIAILHFYRILIFAVITVVVDSDLQYQHVQGSGSPLSEFQDSRRNLIAEGLSSSITGTTRGLIQRGGRLYTPGPLN